MKYLGYVTHNLKIKSIFLFHSVEAQIVKMYTMKFQMCAVLRCTALMWTLYRFNLELTIIYKSLRLTGPKFEYPRSA